MNSLTFIKKLKQAEACEIDIKNNPNLYNKISTNIQIKSLSNKVVIFSFEFISESEDIVTIYAYDESDTYLFILEINIEILIKWLS